VTGRKRQTVGVSEQACDICGIEGLEIVESRSTRHGLDVLNPAWRPRTRTYELCRNCGVKYLLHDGQRL
jgi:hypothetical protein